MDSIRKTGLTWSHLTYTFATSRWIHQVSLTTCCSYPLCYIQITYMLHCNISSLMLFVLQLTVRFSLTNLPPLTCGMSRQSALPPCSPRNGFCILHPSQGTFGRSTSTTMSSFSHLMEGGRSVTLTALSLKLGWYFDDHVDCYFNFALVVLFQHIKITFTSFYAVTRH